MEPKYIETNRRYREKNKEKIKKINKEYRARNIEKLKRTQKDYYEKKKNTLEYKNYIKEYEEKNKKQLTEYRKKYWVRPEIIERVKKYKKEYNKKYGKIMYQKRKEDIKKHNKLPHVIKRRKEIAQWYRDNDVNYNLRKNLRKRVWEAVKNNQKSDRTMALLGCTIEELKKHLKTKFTFGMSWENYGFYGWHVDHIIPCIHFNLSDPEQQKKCFHYSNLQPLWALDNWRKRDKMNYNTEIM